MSDPRSTLGPPEKGRKTVFHRVTVLFYAVSVTFWKTHTSISSWLVLPRDLKVDGGRQSAGAMSLKEIVGLDGVELGADGKVRFSESEVPQMSQGPRCSTES